MSWNIEGKRVIVTGANSGIGLATATELARRGGQVMIAVSDEAKGVQATEQIKRTSGADVAVRILDLSRLDSVRAFVTNFGRDHDRLDVLINKAGVMAGSRRQTVDGFEWTLAQSPRPIPAHQRDLLNRRPARSRPQVVVSRSSEAVTGGDCGV